MNERNQNFFGKFKEYQLVKIDLDTYRGNIIAEKTERKKKKYLMKFSGYSDKWNEWVEKENLVKIK